MGVSVRWWRLPAVVCLGLALLPAAGRTELPLPRPVAIEAGLRLDELVLRLERAGLGAADELAARARDAQLIAALGCGGADLLGCVLPGRYAPVPGLGPDAVWRALCAPFGEWFDTARRARAAELGLDAGGLVALAALVEREARRPAERALIAGVLLERLRRGYHLDSPASLRHAVGLADGDFTAAPGRTAFRRALDFNTFARRGPPPAAVCIPSRAALQALLQPAAVEQPVRFRDPQGRLRFALEPGLAAALQRIRPDPLPPATTRGLHYVASNERRQYHFRRAVERLGGVWIGVGAEQNYTMAGWARPELLILLDFDQVVVDLHHIYRVAFAYSPDAERFLAFWHRRQRRHSAGLLRSALADRPRLRRRALAVFRRYRRPVEVRLRALRDAYQRAGQPVFLTDPEQYAHLRALVHTGRVHPLRGDLTARGSMRRLGRVLARHGRIVRALYLSNAEQYFQYTPEFRRNVVALPVDEWSLLLRTRPVRDDYAYVLQWYDNFLRWLRRPTVPNVRVLLPRHALSPARPLEQFVEEPFQRRRRWRRLHRVQRRGSVTDGGRPERLRGGRLQPGRQGRSVP